MTIPTEKSLLRGRWMNRFVAVANAALLIMLSYYVLSRGVGQPADGWEYKDLVTVILTALAVLLAAVTIAVGALAVWGYSALRDAAERQAHAVSTELATKIADRIAREVAEPVATRVALEATRVALESATTTHQIDAKVLPDDYGAAASKEDENGNAR